VQLLKNFPAFYGTQRFSTVFTTALQHDLEIQKTLTTTLLKPEKTGREYNSRQKGESLEHHHPNHP
jgi:hypothetical protein